MELVAQVGIMCGHNLDIAQHRDILRYHKIHSGGWKPAELHLSTHDHVILNNPTPHDSTYPKRMKPIYQVTRIKHRCVVEIRGSDNQKINVQRKNLANYSSDNVDTTLHPPRNLPCEVCGSKTSESKMLLCDGPQCGKGYHTYCLEPPLTEIPENDWFCPT